MTIIVTFIVNYPFHSYWSFFGVLLPLGNALFSCLVGNQIWQQPEGEDKLQQQRASYISVRRDDQ